ncbi:hypothetical protein DFJ73DRAFT_758519 [Zopfochytrium polystomum]|nr:hypothetical protein DFJ73DRAFT_758519 [Zopfochytrium polystomum]
MKLGVNSQLSQLTAAEEPTYHTGSFLKFTSAALHRLDEMNDSMELIVFLSCAGNRTLHQDGDDVLFNTAAKEGEKSLEEEQLFALLGFCSVAEKATIGQLPSNVEGKMTIGHLLLQHLCWLLEDSAGPTKADSQSLDSMKADDSTAAPSADSALARSSMANTPSQIASSNGGSTGGASSSLDSGPSTPTASLDATDEARPKQAAAAAAEAAWKVAQTFKLPPPVHCQQTAATKGTGAPQATRAAAVPNQPSNPPIDMKAGASKQAAEKQIPKQPSNQPIAKKDNTSCRKSCRKSTTPCQKA